MGVPALQLVEELQKAVKAERSLNRDLTHKVSRAENATKEAADLKNVLSKYEKEFMDLQVFTPTICQRLLTCLRKGHVLCENSRTTLLITASSWWLNDYLLRRRNSTVSRQMLHIGSVVADNMRSRFRAFSWSGKRCLHP